MSRTLDIWSALGLAGVGRGMGKHRETSQEELEWMRLTEDLALEHRRKLLAAGYSPPDDVSTWWAQRQVLELRRVTPAPRRSG